MVTEKGIVINVDATKAWVKTVRSSSCEACSSRDQCNTLGGGNEMIVESLNTARAKIGDNVVIGFKSSSLFKLSFLIYIFPILCMIAGAAAGDVAAIQGGHDRSLYQAIAGFSGFGISVILIRVIGKKLAPKKEYNSEVIKITNNKH